MDKKQLQEHIVYEYGSMVTAVCRKMISNPNIAEDAVQEIWVQIIKSLDSFQERSKLSTWIYTICHRVIMKMAAQEKTYSTTYLSSYFRNNDELIMPDQNKHDEWVKEMCHKCLTGTLHCLNNENRLIYLFKDVVQLSYDDMQKIMNMNEETLRKRVSRARTKLRNFLNDECYLYNPNGSCNCRMKSYVQSVNLIDSYNKLVDMTKDAFAYLNSDQLLPEKNYWEKYL